MFQPRKSPSRRAATVLFAALTIAGTGLVGADALDPDTVRKKTDDIFAPWNTTATPGCSVAVMHRGTPLLARAYGMADLEQGTVNRVDTIFEAGSVSKQFTAAAVLLLARNGTLSLDDPVRRYLPEVPDYGVPVTIREMLTHTSGLRDWGSVVEAAGWPRGSRVHTHAHVLDVVSHQRALNFSPGTMFSYCNTGYNLAAILVSRVSGMPFSSFTRTRIFEPLGMAHTSWRDDFTRIVPGRATAYEPDENGCWRLDMPFENVHGNGGLLTTVGDLHRWNANFTDPRVGDADFVAAQQHPMRLANGSSIEYAMGLFATSWRGIREVSHSGATAGYRAFVARYPDQEISIAVLCNAANANPSRLAHQVVAACIEDALEPPERIEPIELEAEALQRRSGVFRSQRNDAALRLSFADGSLRLDDGAKLIALSKSTFLLGEGARRAELVLDARDRPIELHIVATNGEVERYLAEPPAAPSIQELEALAGIYRSDEAETQLEAAFGDRGLELRQRPDTVVALRPAWKDAFTASFGTVIFRRDADGRVTGLSLVTPRMWDLRFSRVAGDSTRVN